MSQPSIDDRDWGLLSVGERIRQLEVEGYVVLPGLLSAEQVLALKSQTAALPLKSVDYSPAQEYCHDVQFRGGAITELIGQPEMIRFLKRLFGDELLMMHYAYAKSGPGHPGISLHTDGQPYGSEIFGYEGSCPFLVRVLYYLDDLTADVSPFRVVPRSHLCMHGDANPYKRYESHPEERYVCAKAGSVVLINHRVFHGNAPNRGQRARELLAIAYRPAWASPIAEVKPWPAEEVARLPAALKPFFGDRNRRDWDFAGANKPAKMAQEAPGMNPSRWDLG